MDQRPPRRGAGGQRRIVYYEQATEKSCYRRKLENEQWTHKKSVADLAQTMSLNVDKVWKETDAGSVLVPVADVQVGDRIVIHTGNVIPLDGKVVSGEAMVNQASITGELQAVFRPVRLLPAVPREGADSGAQGRGNGQGRWHRHVLYVR